MSQSTFVKSTLILSVATLLSKILGSIFRIPLQNIAGDEVLGIFSMVYPVYMVALILSVAGIPVAISKLIAEARAQNDRSTIKHIYLTASILALLFGLTSFTLIYSFSDQLAAALGGPSTKLALVIVAATLLIAPYMAVYRGYFQGFEDMKPTAVSQVLEQLIRVGIILFMAYFLVVRDYSNEIVAGGVMVGSIAGALASLIYLRITYVKRKAKISGGEPYSWQIFWRWGKRILSVSIPIAIGAVTMALLNFVDSFTIPFGLRSAGASAEDVNYIYGIYGRGLSLVQIATVFATSIVLPLIPHMTKKLVEQDELGVRQTIEHTHFLTHFLSWPAAFGLLALTLPLNLALFTNLEGSSMLAIIGFSSVFTSLTILGTGILQGMNLAKLGAIIIIGGVVLKIFTNIFLIKLFGLDGAAISTLLVYLVLFIVNSRAIYQRMPANLIDTAVLKMVLASLIMGLVVGLPTLYFDLENWSRLFALGYVLLAISVGALLYFGQLFVWKVIDKQMMKSLLGKRQKGGEKLD